MAYGAMFMLGAATPAQARMCRTDICGKNLRPYQGQAMDCLRGVLLPAIAVGVLDHVGSAVRYSIMRSRSCLAAIHLAAAWAYRSARPAVIQGCRS